MTKHDECGVVTLLILFHNVIPFQFLQTVQTIFVIYIREATNKQELRC
jgi:hypothetical protein